MKLDRLALLISVGLSFLALTCSAAPLDLPERETLSKPIDGQDEQPQNTNSQSSNLIAGDGGIPPGADMCPQTVVVNQKPVEVAVLLTECQANQELLELFHVMRKELTSIIGNSKNTHVICSGFVALVEDVSKRQELNTLCKDHVLDDVSVVRSSVFEVHICMVCHNGIMEHASITV